MYDAIFNVFMKSFFVCLFLDPRIQALQGQQNHALYFSTFQKVVIIEFNVPTMNVG